MPGSTLSFRNFRGRCLSEGTVDAAGLSGAYWEDVRAFGFIVQEATPNGFSFRVTRLAEILSTDRRTDRVAYQLDIEDPSLSLPPPLGFNADYSWTFTEFDGAVASAAGRRVVYAALADQPFTIAITRTRPPINPGDGSRVDTLTLRERGNDLDRNGIEPGSGGGGPATAPGYAFVYNATALVTPTFCPADLDDGAGNGTPDGGVTIDDLLYYLDRFEAGTIEADLDDGSGQGTPDGGVTIDDLLYYLDRFETGC